MKFGGYLPRTTLETFWRFFFVTVGQPLQPLQGQIGLNFQYVDTFYRKEQSSGYSRLARELL